MAPLRILQVVHGFPPRENAGTEQYAAMLAARLTAAGHTVHTFAATMAPGRAMYSTVREADVTRIVNNVPGRETRHDGADPAIDRAFDKLRREFKPDLVHIQHVAGLSSTLPLGDVPAVWTLHDGWAWCASGGLELRADVPERPCDGPGAGCAACASAWLHDTAGVDQALSWAQRLARWIPADRLHRMWKSVPSPVRRGVLGQERRPVSVVQIQRRALAFQTLAGKCTMVAPSRFLAERAEQHGLGHVRVIPHGIEVPNPPRSRAPAQDAPFVFLGTLARHKGPERVRAAWERAGRPAPLRVHGPTGSDPAFVVENDGPLAHEDVAHTLASARALVLGSIWPENAPLVILEARAAGCPVIAPDIGGIPELVADGVDGWLYPAGDVAALAERMLRPLPQTTRPPPTLDAHVTAIERVYAEALTKPRSQKPSRLP
jgi:glycosyltransferase involved in cell wall biosynthesis